MKIYEYQIKTDFNQKIIIYLKKENKQIYYKFNKNLTPLAQTRIENDIIKIFGSWEKLYKKLEKEDKCKM